MNGILPLWKPKGLTSHDCVIKIRKLFRTKKVGHTGTLDPEVEGVLPICIGQATKIVPYLTETKKTYIAEISLGTATETEDSQGNIIEKKEIPNLLTEPELRTVLQQFNGVINQVPPMYSAVKINGKKLYEYAREGQVVERPKRAVTIHSISLLTEALQLDKMDQRFSFEVTCSKGTYIRTLCVDIGKKLGYPAHMSNLVRTQTGSFNKDNSYTLEEITKAIELKKQNRLLYPISKGVDHLDTLYIEAEKKTNVLHGQKLQTPEILPSTTPFRVQFEKQLLALYQIHPTKKDQIKPVKVFQLDEES